MAETRRTEQMLPPDLPTTDPERELPPATTSVNPRLNEAAEAIGSALGSATRQVQNARDRFTVIPGGAHGGPSATDELKHSAQQKMEELKERAGATMEQARIQANATLQEARVKASRLARNARNAATERARLVRYRAARLGQERPLALLAGIAGVAFLLGVFLRLRRGNRG